MSIVSAAVYWKATGQMRVFAHVWGVHNKSLFKSSLEEIQSFPGRDLKAAIFPFKTTLLFLL